MAEKIGFLFPGQGAQSVGMGRDIYEKFPAAKKIYDQADKILGYSISQICFEGPEEKLTKTFYAQPAIYVTSMACLEILKERFSDLVPSFCAGLSLGEFSALTAAQSISFEDGLRLVQKRAEAMEKSAEHNPGTMASILGFSQAQCEEVAKEAGCEVANLNSPDQIVLSGTVETVTKACSLAEAKGAKRAIMLKVGGAFHSTLMREAKDDLEKALKATPIQTPKCVFIPNVTAQKASSPEEIRALLAKQLMSPVRWIETMDRAAEENLKLFIEIGPGKVLKGLARKTRPELSVENLGTVNDIEKLQPHFAHI